MIRRARPWLGTIVEIAGDDLIALEAGFAAIAHAHAAMSFHEATSDLAALRDAPPGGIVAIDPETVQVLRFALDLYLATDGLFDVTIGRQLVATKFLPRVSAHPLTYYNGTAADIEIIDDAHVICHRPMLIDLGGIAKGHAVDMAVAAMQAASATQGIVNAGGDLRVFGPNAQTIWLRRADGQLGTSLDVRNLAVASSSNLLFRQTSRGADHSPHIGLAGKAMLSDQTITVTAPMCMCADAVTKIAMADAALAERLLAKMDGQVIVTPCLSEAA